MSERRQLEAEAGQLRSCSAAASLPTAEHYQWGTQMTSRDWDAEHAEARAARREQGTAPFPASVALSSLTEARLEDEDAELQRQTDELRRFLLRHDKPEPGPEPEPEPEPKRTCFDPAAAFFSPASILLGPCFDAG